jgi:hypothetical protein
MGPSFDLRRHRWHYFSGSSTVGSEQQSVPAWQSRPGKYQRSGVEGFHNNLSLCMSAVMQPCSSRFLGSCVLSRLGWVSVVLLLVSCLFCRFHVVVLEVDFREVFLAVAFHCLCSEDCRLFCHLSPLFCHPCRLLRGSVVDPTVHWL